MVLQEEKELGARGKVEVENPFLTAQNDVPTLYFVIPFRGT